MRLRSAYVALAVVIASCTADRGIVGPNRPGLSFDHTATHPSVRFSELHYDNAGTDAGERIEVSGPAGADLTGWSVVLYNGNGGASYTTTALTGTIPATCDERGVVVLSYGVNGIQNGNPDGIALVNGTTVVEFLSYGGTFAATNGPALGMTSTDIGVAEPSTTPIGHSLGRNGDGTWSAAAANTFGACNDADEPPPPAVVDSVDVEPDAATITVGGSQAFTAAAFDEDGAPAAGVDFTWSSSNEAVATVDDNGVATGHAAGDAVITAAAPNGVSATASLHVDEANGLPSVRFSEIHYDNAGVDANEAIEVEGPQGASLTGWSIVLYNGNGGVTYNTRALAGTFDGACDGRGVLHFTYPTDGIQNGSPDGFALINAGGQVVEFLSYEGGMTASNGPALGMAATDIGVSENSAPAGQSLQRDDAGVWSGPKAATLGACNVDEPPPPSFTFQFTGRDPSGDPPLPVGFEDQLFFTVRDNNNQVVVTTVTWSSESPAIASVDERGVVRALAAGSAVIRATTPEGTSTISLPTRVAVAGGTAQYGHNTEFGEPADGDDSDDIIITRDQLTSSWNPNLGHPNWVSYNIDATHFGPEDRCDCFTYDPELPAAARYTTADYTGAGAFHGYGIDRGHLARSFDRTTGSLDNAMTYYFSNIIPQAADNNQGPWANFENELGNRARFDNREVFVIAGGAGSKGTVKNEGLIDIPARTWKVALLLPRDHGLADVDSWDDVEVIAVNMPNDPGIRFVDWNTYRTTVDAIEALTGYDLLALLPDQVEIAVESGTRPPTAATDGPYSGSVGTAITMSGAGSTDPDGDALTYAWDFGDGTTGSGATVSHTYASAGTFTVVLTVTDVRGLVDDVTTTADVASAAELIGQLIGQIDHLEELGAINHGNANSLTSKLDAAAASLAGGNEGAALNQLHALGNEIDAMEQSGRLTASQAAALRAAVQLITAAIGS